MNSQEHLFRDFAAVITRVMNQFHHYEESPRTYGCGQRLYRAEIYTMEAIGRYPHINVTQLADHLGITKGAASQAISKLVRKELVRKGGLPGNAKEVHLELTAEGQRVLVNLNHHYHLYYQASARYYGAAFAARLTALQEAFEEFGKYFQELTHTLPVDYPPPQRPPATRPRKTKEHYRAFHFRVD